MTPHVLAVGPRKNGVFPLLYARIFRDGMEHGIGLTNGEGIVVTMWCYTTWN